MSATDSDIRYGSWEDRRKIAQRRRSWVRRQRRSGKKGWSPPPLRRLLGETTLPLLLHYPAADQRTHTDTQTQTQTQTQTHTRARAHTHTHPHTHHARARTIFGPGPRSRGGGGKGVREAGEIRALGRDRMPPHTHPPLPASTLSSVRARRSRPGEGHRGLPRPRRRSADTADTADQQTHARRHTQSGRRAGDGRTHIQTHAQTRMYAHARTHARIQVHARILAAHTFKYIKIYLDAG